MKTLAGPFLAAALMAAAPAPAQAAAGQPITVAAVKKPVHHTARHRTRHHFRHSHRAKPATPTK
jgi:hypothetical protein